MQNNFMIDCSHILCQSGEATNKTDPASKLEPPRNFMNKRTNNRVVYLNNNNFKHHRHHQNDLRVYKEVMAEFGPKTSIQKSHSSLTPKKETCDQRKTLPNERLRIEKEAGSRASNYRQKPQTEFTTQCP